MTENLEVFGLDNIHYTCYLNTTLQCLFSIKNFRKNIVNEKYDSSNQLTSCLKQIIDNKDKIKFLKTFIKHMMIKVDWFRFLEHNDMHEFLLIFIDQLNQEIVKTTNTHVTIPHYKSLDDKYLKTSLFSNSIRDWKLSNKNENCWLNDMLSGQIVNQIICGHCNKIHHNFEIFREISLEITDTCASLEDCMKEYFGKHYINIDDSCNNKWKCDKCKETKKSLKSCKLIIEPEVLIISLKRFKHNNGRFIKNNKKINIPGNLNLFDYCLSKNKQYNLNAIANHMGSLSGGHYNSYVKYDEKKYLIDDESVHSVRDFSDNNAYTIFYSS